VKEEAELMRMKLNSTRAGRCGSTVCRFYVTKDITYKTVQNLLQISTRAFRIRAKTTECATEGLIITTVIVPLVLPDRSAIEV